MFSFLIQNAHLCDFNHKIQLPIIQHINNKTNNHLSNS
ncbi:hypothetical protein YPPY66_1852 [Yersinia pestis PY-66]|uniref:Uncharacterized protein n=2 Tax=Yersinia pestis TaxID=632 RepID=A0AAV3BBZ8_YERPE|nr:hypothetical protein YpAngola_A1963 [Yersinia pestis Angola]ADV99312.1 hypothetical protein YPC_2771 [Yersinia pestis biovar Medievalis str. Harbin 35]EDR31750.1 hypothetical protein YPIP275_3787 [Yersinia pestis biovar Orientalis str. IP275]EDR40632.1 hypothetical protein YpF1991016_0268 [Yersinia pestis biovar Orientalis str. F1991016]EDR43607.1 hypothetical protein YpE1979001_2666 [Yersinia pestis biovar Antiqua str. E1979001]EDR51518.1 hypothetical protein YpB42003004_2433 [Yersinia pes